MQLVPSRLKTPDLQAWAVKNGTELLNFSADGYKHQAPDTLLLSETYTTCLLLRKS